MQRGFPATPQPFYPFNCMVATLEQLRQDVIQLEQKTADIVKKVRTVFSSYCDVLTDSLQRQLILASFHLCTQTYPEAFLRLSFSARGELQKQLQQLSQQLTSELSLSIQSFLSTEVEVRIAPDLFMEGWEEMEESMVETLRLYSRKVNEQFQAAGLLQVSSIGKLLDIAAKAEASGRSITNPPLLLKALVDSKDATDLPPEPVVALYLQFGDLEFTDPELMSWRQKLRPLLQSLMQLQQSYEQKQSELLVAEAIAAWRSSWVVQSDEPLPNGLSEEGGVTE
jgi:hypothetical protein